MAQAGLLPILQSEHMRFQSGAPRCCRTILGIVCAFIPSACWKFLTELPPRCAPTLVEAPCLQFHDLCLLPHDTDAQGTEQPNGTTLNEAFNVLTTDERYMFTKALTVGLDQAGPMRGLLRLHFFKDLGRGWIPIAQTVGEVAVNAAIFLFQ